MDPKAGGPSNPGRPGVRRRPEPKHPDGRFWYRWVPCVLDTFGPLPDGPGRAYILVAGADRPQLPDWFRWLRPGWDKRRLSEQSSSNLPANDRIGNPQQSDLRSSQ